MRTFQDRAYNHIAVLICSFCGCLSATGSVADDLDVVLDRDVLWILPSTWLRPVPLIYEKFTIADRASNDGCLGDEIPGRLIHPVPRAFRKEAATLLGASDIIPLSKRQCRLLSCPSSADRGISEIIAMNKKTLESLSKSQPGEYTANFHAQYMVSLHAEIERLEKWRSWLHPFLAKAVARKPWFEFFIGFSGNLCGNTLLIRSEDLGSNPLFPVENVPVVIFLERQPSTVYRDVSKTTRTRFSSAKPPDLDRDPIRPEGTFEVSIEP